MTLCILLWRRVINWTSAFYKKQLLLIPESVTVKISNFNRYKVLRYNFCLLSSFVLHLSKFSDFFKLFICNWNRSKIIEKWHAYRRLNVCSSVKKVFGPSQISDFFSFLVFLQFQIKQILVPDKGNLRKHKCFQTFIWHFKVK